MFKDEAKAEIDKLRSKIISLEGALDRYEVEVQDRYDKINKSTSQKEAEELYHAYDDAKEVYNTLKDEITYLKEKYLALVDVYEKFYSFEKSD